MHGPMMQFNVLESPTAIGFVVDFVDGWRLDDGSCVNLFNNSV